MRFRGLDIDDALSRKVVKWGIADILLRLTVEYGGFRRNNRIGDLYLHVVEE